MPRLPKLAIVGRPNVGKSALFNRICKKRIAIVDEAEGITRDRLYASADLFGLAFQVIDTGGIDTQSGSTAPFNTEIRRQAEIAIEEADTIVMVVDGQIGATALDYDVAKILLRANKPVCLAVNKVDDLSKEQMVHQFHSLGISKMIPISAIQGLHIAELLEIALESFPRDQAVEDSNSVKVAVIGRPNVGKSTFVNFLLNDDRCIVSPVAGTTRDNVDVEIQVDDQLYTLIDTAGIRRKHAEHETVDKFAAIRTERAIERADVCIFILDAQQGITHEEKKIANMIELAGKGCILLFNKWDIVKGFRMEHCLKGIRDEAHFLNHCPVLFISSQTGRNLDKVFPLVKQVHQEASRRITTGQLNKFIMAALQKTHPPMIGGKRLRIYYMTQVDVAPPKFVLFVNYPNLMTEAYKKYLYNQFREAYGFQGSPLLIYLKGKAQDREEGHEMLKSPRDRNRNLPEDTEAEGAGTEFVYTNEPSDDEEDDFNASLS